MARPKKQVKAKEPVRLRFNKLKNGNTSIYLDIYHDGRRSYQFLKLYLVPETDFASKIQNTNTLATANAIKAEKILELTNKVAGITDRSYKAKMLCDEARRHQVRINMDKPLHSRIGGIQWHDYACRSRQGLFARLYGTVAYKKGLHARPWGTCQGNGVLAYGLRSCGTQLCRKGKSIAEITL